MAYYYNFCQFGRLFLSADSKGKNSNELLRGYSLTQESVEQLWHILDHIYYFGNTEAVIEDIIAEETGAVFVGDKTAEQAAKIIQEKVSLFLQE